MPSSITTPPLHFSAVESVKESNNMKRSSKTVFKDWPNDAGFDASVEQRKPIELKIKGRIPGIAAGTLYRIGPGDHRVQTGAKEFSCSHWFDGFSHVYRFEIVAQSDGSCKVIYNSRRQVDELVDSIRKTGKRDFISFAQKRDPCESLFGKLKTIFSTRRSTNPGASNIGVTIAPNVLGLGAVKPSVKTSGSRFQNLVAFTDSAFMKILDSETLEPMGVTDQTILNKDLSGPLSGAHGHFDPANGDLYNYNLAFGATDTYRIFRVSATTGKTDILATIRDVEVKGAYVHSFFMTEDFVILAIWPAYFAAHGMNILWKRNLLDAIEKFDPNAQTTWLVVDRKHGRGLVSKFKSPPVFSFHSVNAWQEEHDGKTDIFCDVVQYKDLNVMHRFYYDNMMSTGPGAPQYAGAHREDIRPHLARYRLANIAGSSSVEEPSPAEVVMTIQGPSVGDMPTMNPKFTMGKARYVYSIVDRGVSSFFDAIAKTDWDTQTAMIWAYPHHTPGEPIFVPNSEGVEEDDGILLTVMLNGDKGTSYLLCLDARTMKELGRAEVETAVGFGFHGRHIPSSL